MKKYKGLVSIGGRKYDCEVIDGERFIDGKTVDEFLKTLDPLTLCDMAIVGFNAVKNEIQNKPRGGHQKLANELYQKRNN
ncbi:MAG: hypothetical protein PHS93_09535 [Candidatus Omnitrophica bacterium]|nr:hypothetical protein [Candidatus Omnitrophota bacterium]MDD5353389.1 hypothetical protein [Candidatus Omnitrophota bacterium]